MSILPNLDQKGPNVRKGILARSHWKNRCAGSVMRGYFKTCQTNLGTPAKQYFDAVNKTASPLLHQALHGIAASDKAKQMVLMAAVGVLAHKYSQYKDIFIFTLPYEVNPGHGLLGGRIPIRMTDFQCRSFRSLLTSLKGNLIQDFNHEFSPVDDMPSFSGEDIRTDAITVVVESLQKPFDSGANIGLGFSFNVLDHLSLTITYNSGQYDSECIELLADLFFDLLSKLLANLETNIDEIELLNSIQEDRIINTFNKTPGFSAPRMDVLERFDAIVRRKDDSVAIEFDGTKITFGELNSQANRLAGFISAKQVQPERPISIFLDRSIEFVICVLAVIKSGNTYVPIAQNTEDQTVNDILRSCQSALMLTKSSFVKGRNFDSSTAQICIDVEKPTTSSPDDVNPYHVKANEVLCIMHLSDDKGVLRRMICTQSGLLTRLDWETHRNPYRENEVLSNNRSIDSPSHLVEIFGSLLNGVKLVIFKQPIQRDAWIHFIINNGISRIHVSTQELRWLARSPAREELKSLKLIFCIGGVLTRGDLEAVYKHLPDKALVILHSIGCISDAIFSCPVSPDVDATVGGQNHLLRTGKILEGNRILIIDQKGSMCPIGVPGSILVSGTPLTIPEVSADDGAKRAGYENPIFDSGIVGYWLPSGQVKLLGVPSELAAINFTDVNLVDISETLCSYPGIDEAYTIVGGKDEPFLISFYVAETQIGAGSLRRYLLAALPDGLIPFSFVRLEKLPLLSNGNIAEHTLCKSLAQARVQGIIPRTDLELHISEIWSKVLNEKGHVVYVNHSIFDSGATKPMLGKFIKVLKDRLGLRLSIEDLLEYDSVQSLSAMIEARKKRDNAQIKIAEAREYYNLSIAQMRLYYFYQLDRSSMNFNLPTVLKVVGDLDVSWLKDIFNQIIVRHESLRTSFEIVHDQPVQRVFKAVDFDIEYFESDENNVDEIIKQFIRPFDLSLAPLFRVGLVSVSPSVHFLLVDVHHIVSDGTSVGLLVHNFMALCKGLSLLPLELTYKDYTVWQHSSSYQRRIAKQRDFWVDSFAEEIKPLDIPMDLVPHADRENDSVDFNFSIHETNQLKDLAAGEVTTISMVILSVLNIFLSKIANQDDIVIGMAVAGRENVELEDLIGMFPVILPIRSYPKAHLTFREFLTSLKSTFLETLDNQSYQYEELAKELNLDRSTRRNPWFDVMFLYQNFDRPDLLIPGLAVTPYKEQNIVSHEDITFKAVEEGAQLFFRLTYATALFKEETIQRFVLYFKRIALAVIDDADIKLSDISITTLAERRQLLEATCNVKEISRTQTFTDIFKEQVEREPDRIAVEHNDTALSYRALYLESLKLASLLVAKQVGPKSNVVLLLPRGIGMLKSILAVFHAGAAYVPIDIEFPIQRVKEILLDSDAVVVVASNQTRYIVDELGLSETDAKVVYIEQVVEDPIPDQQFGLRSCDDLAYMIYTSGTTGKPKGVMIHQLGMMNHLLAVVDFLHLTQDDIIAQTASCCFDISVWQFLTALMIGAKVQIVDKEQVVEPESFLRELQVRGVTVVQSVPSLLTTFLDELHRHDDTSMPALRWMIPTGESLSPALVAKWYSHYPSIPLLNAYGPAEASDDITTYVVPPPEDGQLAIPVGKPVQNMHVYVLDEALNLCPPGVKGEICVAGLGVGYGYWKDAEKTKKAFVKNPFAVEFGGDDYSTLYKTGDLGYYLEDNNIVCLGRRDHQIKIRGQRVEIDEIQIHLLRYDQIREAAIIPRAVNGENYLVAYYVSENEIDNGDLKTFLEKSLPQYMVPSFYVHVLALPVTLNGKLDMRALAALVDVDIALLSREEYVAPSSQLEATIVRIWEELLGAKGISVNANFFRLGGHSLSAIRLRAIMKNEIDVDVPVKVIFQLNTISGIAKWIEDNHANEMMFADDYDIIRL